MRAVTRFTQSFFTVQMHILESPYGDERVVVDAIDSVARASTRESPTRESPTRVGRRMRVE
jgi:hypothetical protein